METQYTLLRFVDAHDKMYDTALSEIRAGRKATHWMWYVFPQLTGLGKSEFARFYGIENKEEAAAFLQHPVLGKHLVEISQAVFQIDKSANEIFGSPDDLKLQSSMTLFSHVKNAPAIFDKVIGKFYDGQYDTKTVEFLRQD